MRNLFLGLVAFFLPALVNQLHAEAVHYHVQFRPTNQNTWKSHSTGRGFDRATTTAQTLRDSGFKTRVTSNPGGARRSASAHSSRNSSRSASAWGEHGSSGQSSGWRPHGDSFDHRRFPQFDRMTSQHQRSQPNQRDGLLASRGNNRQNQPQFQTPDGSDDQESEEMQPQSGQQSQQPQSGQQSQSGQQPQSTRQHRFPQQSQSAQQPQSTQQTQAPRQPQPSQPFQFAQSPSGQQNRAAQQHQHAQQHHAQQHQSALQHRLTQQHQHAQQHRANQQHRATQQHRLASHHGQVCAPWWRWASIRRGAEGSKAVGRLSRAVRSGQETLPTGILFLAARLCEIAGVAQRNRCSAREVLDLVHCGYLCHLFDWNGSLLKVQRFRWHTKRHNRRRHPKQTPERVDRGIERCRSVGSKKGCGCPVQLWFRCQARCACPWEKPSGSERRSSSSCCSGDSSFGTYRQIACSGLDSHSEKGHERQSARNPPLSPLVLSVQRLRQPLLLWVTLSRTRT